MKQEDLQKFNTLPPVSGCRVIDFEKAQVVPGIIPHTWFLSVSGTKPWVTMVVSLVPRIYIVEPEYWGIEVVGCQHGLGLPIVAPYHVALNISHLHGTKGIEVIGANRQQKIDVK